MGTSFSLTLGAAPTTGNIVCVAMEFFTNGISNLVVADGNNNVYAVTPSSPSTFLASAGYTWLAYLLQAPANASATLNFTWATSSVVNVFIDEFSVSGGGQVFDTDAAAVNSIGAATINTPSIAARQPGGLLYASATPQATITAPDVGATLGIWTGGAGGLINSCGSEYVLSASGTNAVQFSQTAPDGWSGMAMSFYQNTNPVSVFMLAQVGPHS